MEDRMETFNEVLGRLGFLREVAAILGALLVVLAPFQIFL